MPAILDGIKNVVAAKAASEAGQYIKVAGGLLSGGRSGDWLSKMNKSGRASGVLEKGVKFKTKNLAYPLNVEGDPQQGHFIMFMINEQNDAKLKAMKEEKKLKSIAKGLDYESGVYASGLTSIAELEAAAGRRISRNQIVGYPGGFDHKQHAPGSDPAGKTGSLQLRKQATKRLDTAISLYMPPSLSVSYGMKYGEQEIGILAETGAAAIKAFRETSGDFTTKLQAAAGAAGPGAKTGMESWMQKSLDVIAPGAKSLMELESGRIIAPRMEIMFEGVGRRDFSYTFIFIPKSKKESQVVEKIIHEFKYHMHPEFEDDNARLMKFPSTFDILYMYQYGPNNFLNKISTCFLTKMDVEYGADRFTAYERTHIERNGLDGAPPQKTKLSLNFSEMEILSKTRIDTIGY